MDRPGDPGRRVRRHCHAHHRRVRRPVALLLRQRVQRPQLVPHGGHGSRRQHARVLRHAQRDGGSALGWRREGEYWARGAGGGDTVPADAMLRIAVGVGAADVARLVGGKDRFRKSGDPLA